MEMVQGRPSKKRYAPEKEIRETPFVPGLKAVNRDDLAQCLPGSNGQEVNISLLFHKYPTWSKSCDQQGSLTKIILPPSYKKHHLDKVVKLAAKPPKHCKELKARHFLDQKCTFLLETKTRLLVGFAGTGTVFENSISLHPFYGFPVIPGSSIKGLGRSFCRYDKKIKEEKIVEMFGNEPETREGIEEGGVVFLDAWPESSGSPEKWVAKDGVLETDIMTPHYGKYYSNRGLLPSDADSPNPIVFLAVPRGVQFRFCLLPSRTCRDEKIVSAAKDYLISALKTFGIGAKTGSSYGYFK